MEGQYSEKVMEHFRNPHNVGEIPDADGIGNVGNPVCVVEGTLIKCNPRVSAIENIKEGKTRVMSHDGKYHTVKKVFKRKFKGKIFRIFVTESHSIALTPEHHILSARGKIYDWVMPTELEIGDRLLLPISSSENAVKYEMPVKIWSEKFYYVKVKKITTEKYNGYPHTWHIGFCYDLKCVSLVPRCRYDSSDNVARLLHSYWRYYDADYSNIYSHSEGFGSRGLVGISPRLSSCCLGIR